MRSCTVLDDKEGTLQPDLKVKMTSSSLRLTPCCHALFQHHEYFSNHRLIEVGPVLTLRDVGRNDEGTYICVADSKAGMKPVTHNIVLDVLCELHTSTDTFLP